MDGSGFGDRDGDAETVGLGGGVGEVEGRGEGGGELMVGSKEESLGFDGRMQS